MTEGKEYDIVSLHMNKNLTSSIIPKVISATLTSKGQVTIPVEIRRLLGIDTNDKISFVIQPEGTVQMQTLKYPTIASLAGKAGKMQKPLPWKEIKKIIQEERAKTYKKQHP